MKRDMDLCRNILQIIEDHEGHLVNIEDIVARTGRPRQLCFHHCHIMFEAGLLDEKSKQLTRKIPNPGYRAPVGQFDPKKAYCEVYDSTWTAYSLSWKGHEFLGESRNEEHWSQAKEVVKKSGTWSFSVIVEVLKSIAVDACKMNLG